MTDVYKEFFTNALVTQKLKAMLLQLQIQQAIHSIRATKQKGQQDKFSEGGTNYVKYLCTICALLALPAKLELSPVGSEASKCLP